MSLEMITTTYMHIPICFWVAFSVVLGVTLISGLARAADPDSQRLNGKALVALREYVQTAVRMNDQANQDLDLSQKLTDISFGLAYVNSARFIASDAVIESRCGVKIGELHATLRAMQQECLHAIENDRH